MVPPWYHVCGPWYHGGTTNGHPGRRSPRGRESKIEKIEILLQREDIRGNVELLKNVFDDAEKNVFTLPPSAKNLEHI